MTSITKRMRDLREDHDISQAQLAKVLGVAAPRISEWEQGKYRPSIDVIIALANFYNVSTDYILGISDDPRRK